MKREFDFVGKTKLCLIISGSIVLIGILCNIFFGTQLDVQFKGGTIVKYSYTGTVDLDSARTAAVSRLGSNAAVSLETSNDTSVVTITLADNIEQSQKEALTSLMVSTFPDNGIKLFDYKTLEPAMGLRFLVKCGVALVLALALLLVYVGFRFRKIGGFSAGALGLFALFHDMVIVYFVFVIFGIKLDDNFVAVLLAILGYSLNDTIVIFDRVRENRAHLGRTKKSIASIVNLSINQSFTRTVNTALCTLIAVAVVSVVALILQIETIISFAVPMFFGVISGFYSTVCLSVPLWVKWVERKEAKEAALLAARKKRRA